MTCFKRYVYILRKKALKIGKLNLKAKRVLTEANYGR